MIQFQMRTRGEGVKKSEKLSYLEAPQRERREVIPQFENRADLVFDFKRSIRRREMPESKTESEECFRRQTDRSVGAEQETTFTTGAIFAETLTILKSLKSVRRAPPPSIVKLGVGVIGVTLRWRWEKQVPEIVRRLVLMIHFALRGLRSVQRVIS